ncbi:PIEZ1 protein, partial [Toxostoma redivivum]|nr:PIEZ1 protein [Toxostoma redivivum]
LQLAYQAWVTNTRTVLRQQERPEQPESPSIESIAERSNVLQRALNTLRFLWLLCQALVDGLTQWLDTCTQEHRDMSRVLHLERCVMAGRLARVSLGGHRAVGGRCIETPEGVVGSATGGAEGSALSLVIPSGCLRAPPSSSSQEQVASLEDVADAQHVLAVPQQRRRTASELLKSR